MTDKNKDTAHRRSAEAEHREHLAHVLMRMPNVGEDADFARRDDDLHQLPAVFSSSTLATRSSRRHPYK